MPSRYHARAGRSGQGGRAGGRALGQLGKAPCCPAPRARAPRVLPLGVCVRAPRHPHRARPHGRAARRETGQPQPPKSQTHRSRRPTSRCPPPSRPLASRTLYASCARALPLSAYSRTPAAPSLRASDRTSSYSLLGGGGGRDGKGACRGARKALVGEWSGRCAVAAMASCGCPWHGCAARHGWAGLGDAAQRPPRVGAFARPGAAAAPHLLLAADRTPCCKGGNSSPVAPLAPVLWRHIYALDPPHLCGAPVRPGGESMAGGLGAARGAPPSRASGAGCLRRPPRAPGAAGFQQLDAGARRHARCVCHWDGKGVHTTQT